MKGGKPGQRGKRRSALSQKLGETNEMSKLSWILSGKTEAYPIKMVHHPNASSAPTMWVGRESQSSLHESNLSLYESIQTSPEDRTVLHQGQLNNTRDKLKLTIRCAVNLL